MLTRCEACHSWFRVRAEHLSAAGGYVTCGHCDAVFNALGNLIEDDVPPPLLDSALVVEPPPSASADAPHATTPAPAGTGPVADAPLSDNDQPLDIGPDRHALEAQPAAPEQPPPDTRAADEAPEPVPPPQASEESIAGDAETESETEKDAEAQTETPPATELPDHETVGSDDALVTAPEDPFDGFDFEAPPGDPVDDAPAADGAPDPTDAERPANDAPVDVAEPAAPEDVPPQIESEVAALEQEAQQPSSSRHLWRAAAVLLLVAGAAQTMFMMRETLVARWPALAPLANSACEVVPCGGRDNVESGIRMVARDVRDHPQYIDALLVNATLVNERQMIASYPDIELRLFNAVGEIIGARRFRPQEYLDDSIDVAAGMPTGRPVYIVMELGGQAAAATSFEFTFL